MVFSIVGALVDVCFALSPVPGYWPQYRTLVNESKKPSLPTTSPSKAHTSATFSPTIPVLLIAAHSLRLISCALSPASLPDGRPSPLALPPSLIIQSLLMLAVQALILSVVVKASPIELLKKSFFFFFSSVRASTHHHHDEDANNNSSFELADKASSHVSDRPPPLPRRTSSLSSSPLLHGGRVSKVLIALLLMMSALAALNLTLHYAYPIQHHDPEFYSVPSTRNANGIVLVHHRMAKETETEMRQQQQQKQDSVKTGSLRDAERGKAADELPLKNPVGPTSTNEPDVPAVRGASSLPASPSDSVPNVVSSPSSLPLLVVPPSSSLKKRVASSATPHTALLLSLSALLETSIPLPTLMSIRAARSTRGVNPLMIGGWLAGDFAKCFFYWNMDGRKIDDDDDEEEEQHEQQQQQEQQEQQQIIRRQGGARKTTTRPSPLLLGAFLSVALDVVVMYYMFYLFPNSEAKAIIKWAVGTGRHRR